MPARWWCRARATMHSTVPRNTWSRRSPASSPPRSPQSRPASVGSGLGRAAPAGDVLIRHRRRPLGRLGNSEMVAERVAEGAVDTVRLHLNTLGELHALSLEGVISLLAVVGG